MYGDQTEKYLQNFVMSYGTSPRNRPYSRWPNEGYVKPEGEAVNRPWLVRLELERDLDPVKVTFLGRQEVHCVLVRPRKADLDIKCVLWKKMEDMNKT